MCVVAGGLWPVDSLRYLPALHGSAHGPYQGGPEALAVAPPEALPLDVAPPEATDVAPPEAIAIASPEALPLETAAGSFFTFSWRLRFSHI